MYVECFLIFTRRFGYVWNYFWCTLFAKKVNYKNGTVIAPDRYLAVDWIALWFPSFALMPLIIYIDVNGVKGEPWITLVDSGLLLAFLIFILGQIAYVLCYFLAKYLKFEQYKDERSVVYLLSCLIYFGVFLILHEYKLAFTFAAIIAGRFLWFDTTWGKICEEICGLFDVIKTMPFGTIIFIISIVAAVCVGKKYYIVMVLSGNVLALIFLNYM